MSVLEIRNLHASVEDTEILKGVNLTLRSGEIHALMGPNGSGKSTLCHVLMGKPDYDATGSALTLDGVTNVQITGFTLTNAGPSDASGITLSEALTLPTGVSVVSATPSAGAFADPTWTLGDLAAGTAGEQITAQERAELIVQIEDKRVPEEVERIVAERVPKLDELTRAAYVEAFQVTLGVLIAMVLLAFFIASFIPRIEAARFKPTRGP